jgi:hypothetical protein
MLILDESGNNLDGPNLTRVASVLRQVAERYGLTIVLACQDLYTDRVARHGAAMIQLMRPSASDPLNAPPAVSHGAEDAAVLEALLPYLKLGRPAGGATGIEEPRCGARFPSLDAFIAVWPLLSPQRRTHLATLRRCLPPD